MIKKKVTNMSSNQKIIQCFQELIDQKQLELSELKKTNSKSPDVRTKTFKIVAYKKALDSLKGITFEITDTSQLKGVKNIGKSTIEKIDEILQSGTCSILNNSNNSQSKMKILKDLQRVTGIGPAKASKLYDDYKITLSDLIKMRNEDFENLHEYLTHHQILGIKYLEHLEERIPHEEIRQIESYLKKVIKTIDNSLNFKVCGSYRRKAPTSGDIDVLIYHDSIEKMDDLCECTYLPQILKQLKKKKFLVDDLTIKGNTKYMGMCKYDKFVRRIDIRFVPKECLGASLLYFTGSGDFNKNMRTYALKNGYTINEYGIYSTNGGKIQQTETEEDIFKVLGLDYVEPWNRKATYKF